MGSTSFFTPTLSPSGSIWIPLLINETPKKFYHTECSSAAAIASFPAFILVQEMNMENGYETMVFILQRASIHPYITAGRKAK